MFKHFKKTTMLKLSEKISKWRSKKYVLNKLQVSIVRDYFLHLSWTCDFLDLPEGWEWTPIEGASFKKQLKKVFLVPTKSVCDETGMNKSQLIQLFLGFLHQLLHHNTDSWWSGHPRVKILEEELRFLHIIVEDISWMLRDDDQYEAPFQYLMEMFEAVANQSGGFIHSMLFSTHLGSPEMEELDAVLHGIGCLKEIIKSSDIYHARPFNILKVSTANSFQHFQSLVNDLQDLLEGEDDQIADVKDQINLLHQGLMHLYSAINSPQSSEIGRLKETQMRYIGEIAHEAQHLIAVYVAKDAPLWYVTIRFTYLERKIQHIKVMLQLQFKEENGSEGPKMSKDFSAIRPLMDEKKINNSNEVMVGFEDEENDILNKLVGEGRPERVVISIIGMPGLGKTTLARKLYNHQSVRDRFDKLSWIVVSQSYETQNIMRDILILINNDISGDAISNVEEAKLVEYIHKTLKRRRYLVVIDDVWDVTVWDKLQICLPDDGNGSRVLLTSRDQSVAPPNSINLKLPFLSEEQCWELLQKKVFHNRTCPPQLQPIGKKIAAKCRGLPLTVSVIAGALSSMDEEERAWEKVGESLIFKDIGEDNTVMQILELSYNYIPDHLKSCFLSFGAYLEDEEVSVGKLKRFWIAKGFIPKENERSKENVAEEYMMELINKSLVMVARRSNDGRRVKACVVHDLLRDLCLRISLGESLWRYSSLGLISCSGLGCYIRGLQRKGATLWFNHLEHSFNSDGQTSSYVRDMRLLRVLHFYRSDDNWDHYCYIFRVEYLINLRYLIIDKVPTWIENLVNLEYLTLESYDRAYLPPTIVKLNKLRYIHAYRAEYSEDWNSGCTSNNNLEHLSRVVVKKLKDEELLKCSSHLRKLKCKYKLKPFDMEESECPHFDLSFLTLLHTLSLSFADNYSGFESEFRFPANITKLTLGCNSWVRWENMQSIVGRLENLEVLKLCFNAFVGDRWDTRDDEFQKLRFLQLKYMSLCEWNVSSIEHFPKLQHLVLRHCQDLKEIPSEMGEIATLEQIEVKGKCLDSLRESVHRIKKEQGDMGNEQFKVIINAADHLRLSENYHSIEAECIGIFKDHIRTSFGGGRRTPSDGR